MASGEKTGTAWLEQLAELIDGEASVADNPGHSDRVHGIVSRDCDPANAISHDDVLALPQNPKPSFLQGSNGNEMIDAGQLRHG